MSDSGIPDIDRADRMLVALGHFTTRAAAQAAIAAGQVIADGTPIAKPSSPLARDARIQASPAHPFASRGGVKLAHGLSVFGVDPSGRTCLDLGASTGGFTDVLLQQGAVHVTAVDVGHGQLHARLAADPRVTLIEGVNARDLTAAHLPAAPELIVCDLSFVSLAKAIGPALALAASGADVIGLFKPQFEVGPEHVGKGGIVTDTSAADRAADRFAIWLGGERWSLVGWTMSPITGGDGNAERLFHARRQY